MQESALAHCSRSGEVKTGDGGSSIGLMQVPNVAGSHRLVKNIEIGIDHLLGKYTMVDCRAGHTLDCSKRCNDLNPSGINCATEQETYSGWQCALRGYNGWGCSYKGADGNSKYCGPDCNDYVKRISSYMDKMGQIPQCSGTTPTPSAQTSSCTITTTSPSTGIPSTSTTPSTPITGGLIIPPGGYDSIVTTAQKYLGCNYARDPVYGTNLDNCKQPGMGYTCATFVATIIAQACGVSLTGHGSMMCDNAGMVPLGNDPSLLKPGDIFSWGKWDISTNTGSVGHTGIYVGRNSAGDYLFIEDTSVTLNVRYATLAQYSNHPDIRYCRLASC
jgi:hypothetical protein